MSTILGVSRIIRRTRSRVKLSFILRPLAAASVMLIFWSGSWAGTATYTYNAIGQLVQISYDNGTVVQYAYDANGNRTSAAIVTLETPASLTARSVSDTEIDLTWTASAQANDYSVERCTGSGCTTFAQVGTTSGTSYADEGLTPSTTYVYQVEALDASNGTHSASSNTASASTQADTTPPTVPTGLTGAAQNWSTVNLSWSASSDGAGPGLAGYKVYRNGTQIGTTSGTSYTDSGLTANTAYSYTVSAYDTVGSTSAQSSAALATTPNTPTPGTPTGLTASAPSYSTVSLSWSAASDTGGPGISGYTVYRGGTQIGTTSGTSYTDSALTANTNYSYTVSAYDTAGHASAQSSAASVTTPNTPAPSAPTGLIASAPNYATVNLSWSAAIDTGGSGISGYKVYRNGTQIGTTSGTTYADSGLSANTTYSYTVQDYDTAGHTSAQSSAVSITTPNTPTPGTPTGLSGSAPTYSTVNLSWNAASDPDGPGISGYHVYRSGTQIGSTSGTSYTDSSLNPKTTYSYTVSAYDTTGNNSAQSSAASVTTPAAPTPTTPGSLSGAPASDTSIKLSWSAASDSGGPGIAGYHIYRNGTLIGNTGGTSFTDAGLSTFSSYTYSVSAYDSFGDTSARVSTSVALYHVVTNSAGQVVAAGYQVVQGSVPYSNQVYWWNVNAPSGGTVANVQSVPYGSEPACNDPASSSVSSGYELVGCELLAAPSAYQ